MARDVSIDFELLPGHCSEYYVINSISVFCTFSVCLVGVLACVHELRDLDFVCLFTVDRPDGHKKAYVRLAPDYDALDVANKVCLTLYA